MSLPVFHPFTAPYSGMTTSEGEYLIILDKYNEYLRPWVWTMAVPAGLYA